MNGVKRGQDTSHNRAWARLVKIGGFVEQDTDGLPDYGQESSANSAIV